MADTSPTSGPPAAHAPALYEAIGGREGCRRLSVNFYTFVERDPLLRPLFPGTTFTCAIEEFAAFLAQFLGGPPEDSQRRWWLSLRESHGRFPIGPRERNAWLENMRAALAAMPLADLLRAQLARFFEQASAYLVNQTEPPAHGQSSSGDEIACRWEAQQKLDQAVAAIRAGRTDRALALADSSAWNSDGPTLAFGLLGQMVRNGNSALLNYVKAKLTADPALVHLRYAGRTLLHEAAAAGNPALTELLLRLGADPNAPDGGGHTPLYSVANECALPAAPEVVRTLMRAGAAVNACDGVKHCTPLHMAARRGNAAVAEALLACGADLEARDSLGDTPLRRAVNCNKLAVASLLLSKGANPHSRGSKAITPLLAARGLPMKQLLQSRTPGAEGASTPSGHQ